MSVWLMISYLGFEETSQLDGENKGGGSHMKYFCIKDIIFALPIGAHKFDYTINLQLEAPFHKKPWSYKLQSALLPIC